MSRKKSSLQSNETAIDRELIQSSYDNIKIIADNLETILVLARELDKNISNGTTNDILMSTVKSIRSEVDILNLTLANTNPEAISTFLNTLSSIEQQIVDLGVDADNLATEINSVLSQAQDAQTSANSANTASGNNASLLTQVQSNIQNLSTSIRSIETELTTVQDYISDKQAVFVIAANSAFSTNTLDANPSEGIISELSFSVPSLGVYKVKLSGVFTLSSGSVADSRNASFSLRDSNHGSGSDLPSSTYMSTATYRNNGQSDTNIETFSSFGDSTPLAANVLEFSTSTDWSSANSRRKTGNFTFEAILSASPATNFVLYGRVFDSQQDTTLGLVSPLYLEVTKIN